MKLRLLLVLGAIVLAACGGSERHVSVILDEFSITPFTVVEGETIVFDVTNKGVIDHEFRFVADTHDHNHDHDGIAEHVLLLAPGETGAITITFDGDYAQATCMLPGHFEAGMFTNIQGEDE